MKSLIDDREDQDEHHYARRAPVSSADREITLGTTMILLIFFALAVQDAAVFGFGFSMGSKHTGGTGPAPASPASSASFSNFKPAPGNPLGSSAAVKLPESDTPVVMPLPKPVAPQPAPKAVEEADEPAPTPAPIVRSAPAAVPATAAVAPPVPTVPPGPGTVVVQVAALSRQEDADLVATTLRRRGYLVNIRTDTDRLLHVQVGPFANRKDAEAMKARLLADGFNAYIK